MLNKKKHISNKRSREEISESSVKNLLLTARKHFAKYGFYESSMDILCAEAGLTRGALYHHFENKEGLLEAVIKEIDLEISYSLQQEWNKYEDPWEGLMTCSELSLKLFLKTDIYKIYHLESKKIFNKKNKNLSMQSNIIYIENALIILIKNGTIKYCDTKVMSIMLNSILVEAASWIYNSSEPTKALEESLLNFRIIMKGLLTRTYF
jgi:hypothetical protein